MFVYALSCQMVSHCCADKELTIKMYHSKSVASHNCQDKVGLTEILKHCRSKIYLLMKYVNFYVRMDLALTFPIRKTSAMIHSVRITVSHLQAHAFENLAVPYLHVCPSVLLEESIKSKNLERRGERERHESLISLGLLRPNWHVWVPEYTRQPPLSTQSPSLRAGRTVGPVPRWTLARSSGLASTCRCRAACFNWQQEEKRLRAVHDILAASLPPHFLSGSCFLICLNQVTGPSDNTSTPLLSTSSQLQLSSALAKFLSFTQPLLFFLFVWWKISKQRCLYSVFLFVLRKFSL